MISKINFKSNSKYSYCTSPELIENYDLAIADKQNVWICHHRKEEFYTSEELIEMNMYFNVPPGDLVFCKNKKEHYKYPHKGVENKKGKSRSEETKKKISETSKGRKAWNKGKKGVYSEATLEKMSKSAKGRTVSEETRKKMAESKKGKKRFTNGIINVTDFTCPLGFWPGVTRKR